MITLSILILAIFALWFIHGLIEWRRDMKFRAATRDVLYSDAWRKVPPPNWRSTRRRAGSPHNLW